MKKLIAGIILLHLVLNENALAHDQYIGDFILFHLHEHEIIALVLVVAVFFVMYLRKNKN